MEAHHVECSSQQLGQHTRQAGVGGEPGKVVGALPVGDTCVVLVKLQQAVHLIARVAHAFAGLQCRDSAHMLGESTLQLLSRTTVGRRPAQSTTQTLTRQHNVPEVLLDLCP